MIEVNFASKKSGEVFNAYIGANGQAALQIRQRNSGVFEIRTGEETEWREI